MATIKFRLSTKVEKTTERCEILVRFFHGNIDRYAKTNLFVNPKYWNEDGQRATIPRVRVMTDDNKSLVSELTEINTRLEDLKQVINDAFISVGPDKSTIQKDWLTNVVRDHYSPRQAKSGTVLYCLDEYIKVSNISLGRKRHYRVIYRALQRFFLFKHINNDITLDELSGDTLRAFSNYLKDEHTYYKIVDDNDQARGKKKTIVYLNNEFKDAILSVPETRLPQERGQNAINNCLNQFRTFILWAIDNGYTNNNPFRNYEIPASIYGTPYYITIEERNALFNFDLSGRPNLAVQRDIFVFQCVIGCRVSDLRNLTKRSVIDNAIEYIPRKTKDGNPTTVRVPLNTVAKTILKRYEGTPGNSLLPCISDQKYNKAIKDIFRLAGLTRTVTFLNPTTRQEEKRPICDVASSHMARRCFIGNLYKQVKDPNLVGKLSGHVEGSKAFARYRDIDEDMRKELVTMLE